MYSIRLQRSLYVLKQYGRMWYNHLSEYLSKEGYTNDEICPCVFIKKTTSEFVILVVYVDDINLIGTPIELQKAINYLKKEFEMKDLGKTMLCLGFQIEHLTNSIFVHQFAYTEKDLFQSQEKNEELLGPEIPYLSAIGALMRHWNGIKHILRYLKETIDMDLFYYKDCSSDLVGYADAGSIVVYYCLHLPLKSSFLINYYHVVSSSSMSWVLVPSLQKLSIEMEQFSRHEPGVTHVLVTGGSGYIGSHAALRLLKDSYRVTIVDNLSRGNLGAVRILQELFPEPGRFQFIYADLGDAKVVHNIFSQNAFDAVMHFAAVAYVGESTLDPLKYYHNITSNTLTVLEAMTTRGVPTLIYSSTCATYGEPEKMPITEETPQLPINPYGKAKKMAEDIILDFHKNSNRYFNVIGSDPNGRLGEAPRPELREHGPDICLLFLQVRGTDYKTADGTCIRDYIDVTDLVDAHVKALEKARPGKVGIYNVGTGRGRSVKEFVEVCKAATRVPIEVDFLPRRPGDYAEVYSDPTKIQNELNWTAKYTDLQESLQIAWRWPKSHGKGYGSSVATS
ncbi:putative UDP-arabinose 4-epimerase 3 [Capsicum chinense]|nr:putative UDP-arabinose 4-epimerase 3 [Capsicum chinense]